MMWISKGFALGCVISLVVAPAVARDAADDFLAAWRRARQARPNEVETEVWAQYIEKHSKHDLALIGRLLNSVSQIRAGEDPSTALAWFDVSTRQERESAAGPKESTIRGFVDDAGRGLIARVRMNELAGELQKYYRRHVEYPTRLDGLVKTRLAEESDLVDPFGRHFEYQAKPRRLLPDVPRQTFVLRCPSIDANWRSFAEALRIANEPVRQVKMTRLEPDRGQAYAKGLRRDGTFGASRRWPLGKKLYGLALLAIDDKYVLVGWQQFPLVVEFDKDRR